MIVYLFFLYTFDDCLWDAYGGELLCKVSFTIIL